VISIPDTRSPVDEIVRALWDDFLSDVETLEGLTRERRKPTVAIKFQGLEDATIMESIVRVRSGAAGQERLVKEVEFEALTEAKSELGSDVPDGDFYARTMPRALWDAPWTECIERVVLVHRLREVLAQVGFTRFEADGTDIQGELALDVRRAPLAIDSTWLPAVENRGEGLFLQLKADFVDRWLARAEVVERGKQLLAGFEQWKSEHEGTARQFPGTPYFLLHSLSHLLLTAISLECGYPVSSLRERIYSAPGRYGMLVYTASSDAEGTLGGLVYASRDTRRHLLLALEKGQLCSNDPVCAFHVPGKYDQQPLLGSACHGCLLISETSCEQRNEFLDRALVLPTVEQLGCEFLSGV